MVTTELSKSAHKLSLLLLEENGDGEDPTVWEMDYNGAALPGDPRHLPAKLHEWLTTKKICGCESRQRADRELALKIEELGRSNRELEQFAYVASHDLREPLRMVATYTQLLAERYRGKLDRSADQYIDYAIDGALRMQTLIDDLLSLSRVGRENFVRRLIECDLVIEEVMRDLAVMISETGALVYHEPLPHVFADRSYVLQVFQNLIENAIKFRGKEIPTVSVMAEAVGPEWLFSVTDNGIGIAQEHYEDVFIAFQKLHSRSECPGNGIGLAMCKKIVEHYGGRIWVESRVGFGSSFKFTLPASDASEQGAAQA
jgi:light-regulated signal transduction histidine kinase (bacteriophytochrome)